MPDGLAEKTDRMAAQLGVTRSELIQRALERFVEDADEDGITRQLNLVYASTSAKVEAALAATQHRILLEESW